MSAHINTLLLQIHTLSFDQGTDPHILQINVIYILNDVFFESIVTLPACLQVFLHAGGVEIQSAAQPAQFCWDFRIGCLELTGLPSTT